MAKLTALNFVSESVQQRVENSGTQPSKGAPIAMTTTGWNRVKMYVQINVPLKNHSRGTPNPFSSVA